MFLSFIFYTLNGPLQAKKKAFERAQNVQIQIIITKTCLFKYTENFTTKKMKIFREKKSDIFHISAQTIDYGYSLEPPREYHNLCFWAEIRKIMHTPVNPSFTI